MLKRTAALVLCALLATSCKTTPATPQNAAAAVTGPEPLRITLVGTNDIHGWVFPNEVTLPDGTLVPEGGVAAFAGYLAILREKNPGGVLLLDGGDLFQGTLASNSSEGKVVVDAYNFLGYTAAAIGNHEFDYGPAGPAAVALKDGDDPFGALKERIAQAKFPLLAVNIYEAATGARPEWLKNDGTLIVDVKGIKVGIVGLITPTTPQVTNPLNVTTLRFGSLIPEALTAARRVREHGADVVVAIAHAGSKCGSLKDPRKVDSCDATGEIFEMLQGLPPGTFDAVVAGHTHAPMGHFVNGTPVIETWGLGRYFGLIELAIDPATKKPLKDRTQITPIIPVCENVDAELFTCESRKLMKKGSAKLVQPIFLGAPVVKNAELEAMLAPEKQRVHALQHRKLGVAAKQTFTRSYENESPLGNLLSDTLREMEKADIALLNSGGLRADLPAGELTYGDVYEVLPFDNMIATVTVTGEELRRLLQVAYGARKGVFQVSGLKVNLSKCPGQERLKAFTLADGKPPSPKKKYRVVMPDFLARGGDGMGSVIGALTKEQVDFGDRRVENFRDAVVSHWQKRKKDLALAKGGRLTFVDEGQACNEGAKLDIQSALQQGAMQSAVK
jgi:5'-nucleotidase